jgi:hypothetical protein
VSSSVLCRVAVKSELRWSMFLWQLGQAIGGERRTRSGESLAYFSSEAHRQSQNCISKLCVADCWHLARSVGGCAQRNHFS